MPEPAYDLAPAPTWFCWALPALIAVVTFVVFAPVLGHDFVNWDDEEVLLKNQGFRGLGGEQLRWMFTSFWMGHYHPLTWLSFAVDYRIWGLDDAFGYHLTNLLLHVLNAVLFYILAVRLLAIALGSSAAGHGIVLRAAAAMAALLFSVHPLRVESVAWVTERRDVLSVAFLLPCIGCYLNYALGRSHRWGWYVASVGLLLLSLGSKAWGITLPAVLLLLDFYPLRRVRLSGSTAPSTISRVIVEKIPFALLAGVAMITAGRAQATALETMKSLTEHGAAQRVAQAFYGLAFYVWKTVLPTGLAPLYEIPRAMNPFEPRFVFAALCVVWGIAAILAYRRRWPAGPVLLAVYIITLLPVLGFTQSGPQLVADRYSYVACMPLALLAGAAVCWWGGAGAGRRSAAFVLVLGGFVAAIGVFSVLTWRQTRIWQNSRTLWEHSLIISPDSPYAHYNLGVHFANQEEFEPAIERFKATVQLKPDHAAAMGSMGRALDRLGRTEEALTWYGQALQVRDDLPAIHRWYALALEKVGRADEAAKHFRAAARYEPRSSQQDRDVGMELIHAGQLDAAVPYLLSAVRAEPANADLRYNLGLALARLNRFVEAMPHLDECVRLAPDHFDARCGYAAALAIQGDPEGACEQYAAALQVQADSLTVRIRLVDLLVKLDRITEAAEHLDVALKIAPDRPDLLTKRAWLMATSTDPRVRNPAEAVRLAERACQAAGYGDLTMLNTLARAYGENEQFDQAVQILDQALVIATAQQNQAQVEALNRTRAEYEAQRAER